VVATRRSGELPAYEESVSENTGSKGTPRTRKRKPIEITSSAETEEEDDEGPEVASSSAKRRRTGKPSRKPEKKLEIRMKDTRPVVEIPFMDPIPTSKLSPIPPRELSMAEEDVVEAVNQIEGPEEDHDEPVDVFATEISKVVDQTEVPEEDHNEPIHIISADVSNSSDETKKSEEDHNETVDVVAENVSETASRELHAEHPVVQSIPKSISPKKETHKIVPSKPTSPPAAAKTLSLGPSDFLPEEFLKDDEEAEEDDSSRNALEAALPQIRAKKPIFGDVARAPTDRCIGSTTYKVIKGRNLNLAPPSSTQARKTKEAWLQGRSGTKLGNNRKAMSKGFFVSKK
jgi:hypothetical protein